MKKSFLFALLLWLFFVGSSEGQGKKTFSNQQDNFVLALPDTWKEIPKEVLDDFSEKMSAMAPQAEKQHYNYGYQTDSPDWFTYPYILVQVKNKRMPESALKEWEKKSQVFKDGMQKAEKQFGDMISQVAFGNPFYDPQRQLI